MRRLFLILTLTLAACEAGTGGELVEVEVAIASVAQGEAGLASFTTSTGWTVALSEATLSVDSVLVYEAAADDLTLSGLFVGRARAHGGYDPLNGKRVRLELRGPFVIDLLDPSEQALQAVEAEAGEMGSAAVLFADDLEGERVQARVRGTATKGDEVIAFEGALTLEDEPLLRRVEGIRAQGEIAAGGKVLLHIQPSLLLDEAHFERLEPRGDAPRLITKDEQVHTAMRFGTRSSHTYSIEWRAP